MASSFGIYSILFSLVFLFSFTGPSCAEKHTKLYKICSQTINRHLCMKFMKSDSRTKDADMRGLTEVAIDLAYSKAKEIGRALGSRNDSSIENKWSHRHMHRPCSKNYDGAIKHLERAKKLFNEGHYKRIPIQGMNAVEEVHDCRKKLKNAPSHSSHLMNKWNYECELLSDVVKETAEYLCFDD